MRHMREWFVETFARREDADELRHALASNEALDPLEISIVHVEASKRWELMVGIDHDNEFDRGFITSALLMWRQAKEGSLDD